MPIMLEGLTDSLEALVEGMFQLAAGFAMVRHL